LGKWRRQSAIVRASPTNVAVIRSEIAQPTHAVHTNLARQPNTTNPRQSRYKSYQIPIFDRDDPLQNADLTGWGQQAMNDCY
jgi:hypothetical protein